MTISIQAREVEYVGNGTTTVFPFTFPVPAEEYIYVYTRNGGPDETLLPTSAYELELLEDNSGGYVEYPLTGVPIDASTTIVIRRTVPYTQPMDLVNQSGFFPEVVEQGMDWLEFQIQQLGSIAALFENAGFDPSAWLEEAEEIRDEVEQDKAAADASATAAADSAAQASDAAVQAQIALQDILGSGKIIRSGTGAPSDTLGNDGDFYVDSLNWAIYGPKTLGSWGFATSLIGPQGPKGADGVLGSIWYTGAGAPSAGLGVPPDFYLNSVNGDYYTKTGAGWVLSGNLRGPNGPGTGDMLKSIYDTNLDNIVDVAASVPWAGVTGVPAFLLKSGGTMTGPLALAVASVGGAGFNVGYSTALPGTMVNGDMVLTANGLVTMYGGAAHLFAVLDAAQSFVKKQSFTSPDGTFAPINVGEATPATIAEGDIWHESNTFRGVLGGVRKQFAMVEDLPKTVIAGYINGLVLSNSVASPNDTLTIGVGEATSSDNLLRMVLSTAISKKLNVAWAAGDNAGGLDTGVRTPSTWYHVWLIGTAAGAVDVLFSSSPTAPTMPGGWTKQRRIGSIYNQVDNTIRQFVQIIDTFLWKTTQLGTVITNPSTSDRLMALEVPTGLTVEAMFVACHYVGSNNFTIAWSSPLVDAPAVQTPGSSLFTGLDNDVAGPGNNWTRVDKRLYTDTSGRVRSRCSATNASNQIATITKGWIDRRGATSSADSFSTRIMGASGPDHSAGLVPDPGAVPGILRFLREDATWGQPVADMPVTTGPSLLGRATADVGSAQAIGLVGGLDFVGVNGLRRSALTGDVTAAAGDNATVIPDEQVKPRQLTFHQSPGGNAVINPNFANRGQTAGSLEGWNSPPPTGWAAVARGGSAPLSACPTPFCLQMPPNAVTGTLVSVPSGWIACRPNEKIFVGCYAAADGAVTTGVLRLLLQWINNTGATSSASIDFVPTGTWTRFEATLTTGVTAAGYRLNLVRVGSGDTSNIFVTQCWCERFTSLQNSFGTAFDVSGSKLDIAAQGIMPSKMAYNTGQGGDMVLNGAFSRGDGIGSPASSVEGWSALPTSPVAWTIVQYGGASPMDTCPQRYAVKIPASATTQTWYANNLEYTPVIAGEKFVFSCDFAMDTGTAASGRLLAYLDWRKPDGTTNNQSLAITPAPTVAWQHFEGVFTVPAGVSGVRFILSRTGSADTANLYVTNFSVDRYLKQTRLGAGLAMSGVNLDIAENGVKAGNLSIPDMDNQFIDPLFTDSKYWKTPSGGATLNNTDAAAIALTGLNAPTVAKSAVGNGTTSQVNDVVQDSDTADYIAVVPGETYALSMAWMELAGFTGLLRFDYNWLQGNKTTAVGAQVQTNIVDRRTVAAPANATGTFSATLTVPANARWFNCRIVVVWSTTLANAQACYFTWVRLYHSLASPGLFGQSVDGLTPKTVTAPDNTRYLRSDGSWAVPSGTGTGVTNAYGTVTDGVTPASAAGADTLKLRSADSSIAVTTQNNDATHGDNANFQLSATLQTAISNNTSGLAAANSTISANSAAITALQADNYTTNAKLADMPQGTIKGRADGAGIGDPQDLTTLPAIDISAGKITVPATGALATPALVLHGGNMTTDSFGIPNNGPLPGAANVNVGNTAFNKMIDALINDKILSITLPAGPGILLDDSIPLHYMSWSDATERKFRFEGRGIGHSLIWMRTINPVFFFDATSLNADLFARFENFTFQITTPNAGCPIRLRRRPIPTTTKFPQVVIRNVNCRMYTPTLQDGSAAANGALAYNGDWFLDIEGWHQVMIENVWRGDNRCLGGDAYEAVRSGANGGYEYPDPVEHGHDAYSLEMGQGGIRIANCYGPTIRSFRNTGGWSGLWHGHNFDQSPEGGVFTDLNLSGSSAGYRSATPDYQPGLELEGYLTNRDYNVWLGPMSMCGSAAASSPSSTSTMTLEELPPEKNLKVKGSAASGQKVIPVKDTKNIGTNYTGRFIQIGTFKSRVTAINKTSNPETVTINDNLLTTLADDTDVFMSMVGNGDELRTVGGPGWAQTANITGFDRNTLVLSFSGLTDAIALGPRTRWIITTPIVGGRSNPVIDLNCWMSYDTGRADGRHGVPNPTDMELTQAANGIVIKGGDIMFGDNDAATTLMAAAVAGQSTIQVASIKGMEEGCNIDVTLDDSTTHSSYITNIYTIDNPDPTPDTFFITMKNALATGKTAAIGKAVTVYGYLQHHRRGIALGATGNINISPTFNFDGSGDCCIYNPTDDFEINWPSAINEGTWNKTFFNSKIKRVGGSRYAQYDIHSGNRPALSLTDGTLVTNNNGKTYYCVLPPFTELTPIRGLSILFDTAYAGNCFPILWDIDGNPILWGVPGGTLVPGGGMQDVPFASSIVALPGQYIAGMQCSSNSCKFHAHAFGRFGTGVRSPSTFGAIPPHTITMPTGFVPDVAPFMTVYA